MPVNIPDSPVYDAIIQGIADNDHAIETVTNLSAIGLSNRTSYLKAEQDIVKATIAALVTLTPSFHSDIITGDSSSYSATYINPLNVGGFTVMSRPTLLGNVIKVPGTGVYAISCSVGLQGSVGSPPVSDVSLNIIDSVSVVVENLFEIELSTDGSGANKGVNYTIVHITDPDNGLIDLVIGALPAGITLNGYHSKMNIHKISELP